MKAVDVAAGQLIPLDINGERTTIATLQLQRDALKDENARLLKRVYSALSSTISREYHVQENGGKKNGKTDEKDWQSMNDHATKATNITTSSKPRQPNPMSIVRRLSAAGLAAA